MSPKVLCSERSGLRVHRGIRGRLRGWRREYNGVKQKRACGHKGFEVCTKLDADGGWSRR